MKPTKLDRAISVCRDDYKLMVDQLKEIQSTLERGQDIDVRLCMDFHGEVSWIIRSGDASYDQRHSEACGASTIDKRTKLKSEPCCDVLEEMINQCLDQLNDNNGELE